MFPCGKAILFAPTFQPKLAAIALSRFVISDIGSMLADPFREMLEICQKYFRYIWKFSDIDKTRL